MANTEKTMTMREVLTAVIAVENIPAELATYAEEQIAKLDEKNAKRKEKLTPNQEANEAIKAEFLATAQAGEVYTAAGVGATFGISTQKASAILRALETAGKLAVTEAKGANGKGKVKGYTLA